MRDQAPIMCFLMETRLDKNEFNNHCRELPFRNKLNNKYSRGGLSLVWKPEVHLKVINYIENHILTKVVEEDGMEWFLACFYGWPGANQKTKSWALLSHFSTLVNGPWCSIGDFNAILYATEKKSSYPPQYK